MFHDISSVYPYTTVSTSNAEEYVADNQQEDLESDTPSPATKRAKVTVEEDRPDLSPLEIDSILSACVLDLGLFSISKVHKRVCTHDILKEKLLLSRFVPDKTWKAPKHACGKQNRSVLVAFFDSERHPSLRYSVCKDGVYCVVCILFGSQKIALTTEPLKDWSNAIRLVEKHLATSEHNRVLETSVGFLRVSSQKQLSIQQQLSKAQCDMICRNTKILNALISLIVTCGRQNVLIRGKTDQRSNFNTFLQYRAESDDDLLYHLRTCPKNAKYTSHHIQNEIISLCGNQVRSGIIAATKRAGFFTLMADECADISCTEQVAICLRYTMPDPEKNIFVA